MDARGDAGAEVFRKSFARLTLAVGIGAAVLFLAVPDLDLLVAKAFKAGDGRFIEARSGGIVVLRWVFIYLYLSCIALAIAGIFLSRQRRERWLGLAFGQWLFLAACLGAGPGLVANLTFKDQWGRPRPNQVIEFGGAKIFTPALVPSSQCRRNCSFVSGEASSIFIVFYAAALIVPQWSISLAAAGTVAGLAAGLVRMAQGAHFLSDVIFAGVFMALTTLAVHRLMLGVHPAALQPTPESGTVLPP